MSGKQTGEDVRAARERLRRIHGGESCVSVYSQEADLNDRNDPYVVDLRLVLGNDLAEHPADDETPIDWDYAESILADTDFGLAQRDGQMLVVVPEQDVAIKTKGDLRRLASALGITLKEEQPQ